WVTSKTAQQRKSRKQITMRSPRSRSVHSPIHRVHRMRAKALNRMQLLWIMNRGGKLRPSPERIRIKWNPLEPL
ncbi:hypothetical protein K0U00_47480, partial [Paenibacillus sepulcri]|nr:hypothetical protein [Paenibacillus sepulcri]